MGRRIEVLGEKFAMLPFDEVKFFNLPCVYLMVHEEGDALVIHYVGQTSKLNQRYASHHQLAAAKARGATHVLALVVRDGRDRLAFETMMRWFYKPPLNAEEVPSHMQGWRAAMHCGKADIAELARASHMTCERGLLPPAVKEPMAAQG